jgi:hypothetical protein
MYTNISKTSGMSSHICWFFIIHGKEKKEYKENRQFLDIDSYPRGKIYIIWEEDIHKPIVAVKEMVTNCQNLFHDCVIIYWWAFYCLYVNEEHTFGREKYLIKYIHYLSTTDYLSTTSHKNELSEYYLRCFNGEYIS